MTGYVTLADLDREMEHQATVAPSFGDLYSGSLSATPYSWTEPSAIPPRDWLYGRHLIRKFVSVTVAPGGMGKSSLVIAETLAMVTGRSILNQWVCSPLTVWLWNLEDPRDELTRRIQATCQHYEILPDDLRDRLFVDTGREQRLCVAISTRDGAEILRPISDGLIDEISRHHIDVLIVDPFVSSHQVTENDNQAIDMVAKEWGRVADRANCAISLVHHTRKQNGETNNSESARGAKALIDAARDARALNRMSREEGENAGVDSHRLYFRAFSDKANLAPPCEDSAWYRLQNVELANGDHVGVVTPWSWPDPLSDYSVQDLVNVQRAIFEQGYRENVQAKDWVGFAIARVLGLDADRKVDKARIKSCLKVWIGCGALKVTMIADDKGKNRPTVEVGAWANE